LTLRGPIDSKSAAIVVGSGSLRLAGNTVANGNTAEGNATIFIRSGTLILDNSGGNPTSGAQRLTTSGTISLSGGGSTLEFRGTSDMAGSIFSGLSTAALGAGGGGDTYLRTVQQGGAPLAISFNLLSRASGGSLLIENIGTGYVGDSGKPTVTFTITPIRSQNVISSTMLRTLPWVAVTQRTTASSTTITGRWADYNAGVLAATTANFTGDFNLAAVGSHVLFSPLAAGTFAATTNQLASVVLEPGAPGVTLNVTTGLNTFGLMLSGVNDMTVTSTIGSNLLNPSVASTRLILVLSATAALKTNGSLNITSGSTTTLLGGNGFLIMTGSGNQLGITTSSSSGNLVLGGGVLRGTASNLNFDAGTANGIRLNLRGGVLEYDVSSANANFTRTIGNTMQGTVSKDVNWTSFPGSNATAGVGGGGFSAYSLFTNLNYSLTVNIATSGDGTLYWNDNAISSPQLFITDGYALKFGSLRSNATVLWQNNIALDGNSDGSLTNTLPTNRVREFFVTRGVGNVADQTQLNGVISGSPTTDFLKTGTGVLVLNATNTYQGNTYVNEGELRINGQIGAGTVVGTAMIRSGGTLGGSGQALGPVSILGGATIRGGDGAGVSQTLTTGSLTLYHNSTIRAVVAIGTGANNTSITGASLIAVNTTFGRSSNSDTIHIVLSNDGTLNLDGTIKYKRRLLTYPSLPSNFEERAYIPSDLIFTVEGTNFTVASDWSVLVGPTALDVVFFATPEPSYILLLCGVIVGVGICFRRRFYLSKMEIDVTQSS